MEKEIKKFNAFEGRRYEEYDSLSMKRIIFKAKKLVVCCSCGKRLYKISEGYWGFKNLRCKDCYQKICEQADKELGKALKKIL